MWVCGPLGAGKTAVFQCVAEALFEEDVIVAAFFFARTHDARGDQTKLFTTVAYQLATRSPEIGRKIGFIVDADNAILRQSLGTQLRKLIIEPLRSISANHPAHKHCIIIIDDLDGCHGEASQHDLIRQMLDMLNDRQVSLTFLIGSRPDISMQRSLKDDPIFSKRIKEVMLEPSPLDVLTFLIMGFKQIRRKHPLPHDPDWPSQETIDILVKRSSGYFIYPYAVLKFIGDPRHVPGERLEIILSSPQSSALSELDQLYIQILLQATTGARRPIDPGLLSRILGCILLTKKGFSSSMIESLLNLRTGDVHLNLQELHSILHVPDSVSEPIRVIHDSFTDFIFSPNRAGTFCIDTRKAKREIALRCLDCVDGSGSTSSQTGGIGGSASASPRSTWDAVKEYTTHYMFQHMQEVHPDDQDLVMKAFHNIRKESWWTFMFRQSSGFVRY